MEDKHLFISYAHKDAAIVLKFVKKLEGNYLLWYDKGIEVGSKWADVIAKNLKESGHVLFFHLLLFFSFPKLSKRISLCKAMQHSRNDHLYRKYNGACKV